MEEEEEVVDGVLGGAAGSPAVSLSRHCVEQHHVPGVQVHDGDSVVVAHAAGGHLQLHEILPLELQGEGQQGGQAGRPARRSPCRPQS